MEVKSPIFAIYQPAGPIIKKDGTAAILLRIIYKLMLPGCHFKPRFDPLLFNLEPDPFRRERFNFLFFLHP